MNAKHTYTLEAGRCIMRDGKPFVTIVRSENPIVRVEPCDADDFARLCASAPRLLRILKSVLDCVDEQHASGLFDWTDDAAEVFNEARAALCESGAAK